MAPAPRAASFVMLMRVFDQYFARSFLLILSAGKELNQDSKLDPISDVHTLKLYHVHKPNNFHYRS